MSKNFKATVPAELQAKVKALAELFLSDWDQFIERGEIAISPAMSEIEGNSQSGWIPKQDGGFQVCAFYRMDQDASYHFTQKQTDFANEQYTECWNQFCDSKGLDRDTEWDSLTDEQQDEFSEGENDWFADCEALVSFECFVNGYGWRDEPQTITVRVSVNYKDAPYHREKYAEDIKATDFELAEFQATSLEDIAKQFKVDSYKR